MSANLFNQRYFGRQAAWHNMGVVMNERVSATEAVALARLDYQVLTTETFFRAPNPDGDDYPQIEVPVDNTVAIYRTPTPDDPYIRSFGTASKGFTIVQNTDLARILDPMTKEWPVETAGALQQGETVWLMLDMGEGIIAGEQHRRLAWVRNSHKPGQGLMFKPVRTRVVCANTDAVAMNEKGVVISLRHSSDIEARFEEVIKAMDQLRAQNALDEEALEALAAYAVSAEEVKQIANTLYPFPSVPKFRTLNGIPTDRQQAMREATEKKYEHDLARMKKYQTSFQESLETLVIQFPRIGGTGYGVYQAVLEAEQYRRPTAACAVSAFFGQGYEIQKLAKKELLTLVG